MSDTFDVSSYIMNAKVRTVAEQDADIARQEIRSGMTLFDGKVAARIEMHASVPLVELAGLGTFLFSHWYGGSPEILRRFHEHIPRNGAAFGVLDGKIVVADKRQRENILLHAARDTLALVDAIAAKYRGQLIQYANWQQQVHGARGKTYGAMVEDSASLLILAMPIVEPACVTFEYVHF